MKAKSQPPPARWAVYVLRKKAQRIGTVKGADEKGALEAAFAELAIAPQDRFRVSVKREG